MKLLLLSAFATMQLVAGVSDVKPVSPLSAYVPGTVYTQPEPVGLPPLLRMPDGGEVRTVQDWENVRKPEILKFATENIYGTRPVERPADLRFEPIGEEPRRGDELRRLDHPDSHSRASRHHGPQVLRQAWISTPGPGASS